MTLNQYLIGLGILVWVIGYFRVGRVRENDVLVNRTFVRPPFFIYLICGMPRARNIPKGIMAIPSVFSQLNGFFWILCGVTFPYLPSQKLIIQGSIYIIGMVLISVYILSLYKYRAYRAE